MSFKVIVDKKLAFKLISFKNTEPTFCGHSSQTSQRIRKQKSIVLHFSIVISFIPWFGTLFVMLALSAVYGLGLRLLFDPRAASLPPTEEESSQLCSRVRSIPFVFGSCLHLIQLPPPMKQ